MTSDVVLLGKWSNSERRLHLPDPENPEESVCRFDGSYTPKPRGVVDDDQPVCYYCERKAGGRNA